ncbi:hypothetical protein LJC14_00650 [Treponema sp. OttesenSCG-928-L16]|nr:hypothetical protein [Treponema sp. OttesenSCG-928-L16]
MLIIADDLTGANDTAIQFAECGFPSLVLTRYSGTYSREKLEKYQVLSVNTDSRMLSPEEAYARVRSLMSGLKPLFPENQFYKKVDSVLRGNPSSELAAMLDELDIPLAIAAPSYPSNKSILEKGMLISGSRRVDALSCFTEQMERPAEGIGLGTVRKGGEYLKKHIEDRHALGIQVFVCDAVTDDDLRAVYEASRLFRRPLVLCGSAGLARQIAENSPSPAVPVRSGPQPAADGPSLLVMAGTRQNETVAQLRFASEKYGVPVIEFPVDQILNGKEAAAIEKTLDKIREQLKAKHRMCLIGVDSMFKSGIPQGMVDGEAENGQRIARALGLLAREILGFHPFPVLLSTGGDTSLGICESFQALGIEPIEEICPGIPLGRMIGGLFAGQYIITKSGRFGDEKAILTIMERLGL